jgi:hypothetical protein
MPRYYTPTNNPTATFGEKSQSTLELQRRLNRDFNAGLAEDSMFGPLTQAAYDQYLGNQGAAARREVPEAPAPVADTAQTRDIDLSSITGNRPQYATADEYYSSVYGDAPSFEDIYQQERTRVQDVIDSVNAAYAGKFLREEQRAEGRVGSTRAIQARGGGLTSSFGKAALERTADFNEESLAALEAEKQAQIGAILTKARNFSLTRYEQERELAEKKGDEFLQFQQDQQDELRNDLVSIAGQGVMLDDLTDDQYRDLFEGTGFDNQLAFESFYNENLPKAEQPDYFIDETMRGKDGNAIQRRAYVDPVTGKPVIKEYDLGFSYAELDPDKESRVLDGVLHEKQSDGSWRPVAGKGITTPGKTPTKNDLKGIYVQFLKTGVDPESGEQIGGAMGADGYTDPDVYISAFEAWDGTTAEFKKLFPPEDYVNPESYQILPSSIKPADSDEESSAGSSSDL